jgi:hypothetical protein
VRKQKRRPAAGSSRHEEEKYEDKTGMASTSSREKVLVRKAKYEKGLCGVSF